MKLLKKTGPDILEVQYLIIEDNEQPPTGFVDISSIENWIFYGSAGKGDYKLVNDEIKKIQEAEGYDNLTYDEKYYCLVRLVAPPGKTLIDDLNGTIAPEDHISFLKENTANLQKAFLQRDEHAIMFIEKFIWTGVVGMGTAQYICRDVDLLRMRYKSSRIEGTSIDFVDGVLDWINSEGVFTSIDIDGVNLSSNEFSINRSNIVTAMEMVSFIKVENSTANDGFYTVLGFRQTKTKIFFFVEQDIPNINADGTMYPGGLKSIPSIPETNYTEVKDTLNKVYQGKILL